MFYQDGAILGILFLICIKYGRRLREQKIVIEGVTPQGKPFRPSDWAERMSGTMASFKNRRIHYSPLLQPSVNTEGYKCILLDPKLKESSPQVYQAIIDFAKANNLKICDEND